MTARKSIPAGSLISWRDRDDRKHYGILLHWQDSKTAWVLEDGGDYGTLSREWMTHELAPADVMEAARFERCKRKVLAP